MSIQDEIAGNLLRKNADVLHNSGWDLDLSLPREAESVEYERMQITFKNADVRVDVECEIADEPDLQIVGLQKHAGLGPYEGMIFLYDQPQKATFHMASVRFPIDIVFIGSDSRVTKIVENIEPGTPGRWGMPHTSAVVEVNGGFCRTFGIEVGTEVSNKYTPAFKNHKTGEIIVTPGHHDIEILSDRIASDNDIEDWEDGFIDVDGNFYDHHGNIKTAQLAPDGFDWVNGVDEIFDENGATGKYEINVDGDTWRLATDEENARIRKEIRQHAENNPSLFNQHQRDTKTKKAQQPGRISTLRRVGDKVVFLHDIEADEDPDRPGVKVYYVLAGDTGVVTKTYPANAYGIQEMEVECKVRSGDFMDPDATQILACSNRDVSLLKTNTVLSERDILDKMREMKHRDKIGPQEAIQDLIDSGAAAQDEVKYLDTLWKSAQEHFTRSPRVDINPRLQPPNVTNDRFKDHGLPDEYFEDQPMDTNFNDTEGYDVVTYDQDGSVTPTRPS